MESRSQFAERIGELRGAPLQKALAFLWYYRQTQDFEERTPSELANDLEEERFPKPNVTRLKEALAGSRLTIRGQRQASFQLSMRGILELDKEYSDILKLKTVEVDDSIIPNEWVSGTRPYFERMVYQINGTYQYGFYDACAVLCRRLMEALIIETYVVTKRPHDIQNNGRFFPLERLISAICADKAIVLGRNIPKTMLDMKDIGDAAAHDRTYITQQQDFQDIKARYRRLITELLSAAGLRK